MSEAVQVEVPAGAPSATEVDAGQPRAPAAVKESLADQFQRIADGAGGLTEDVSRSEPEETAAEGEKPEPGAPDTKPDNEKPKKEPKPKREERPGKEPPPPNELEALRINANKLGFQIEDGRVTTKERAQFREAQRKAAAERAELEQQLVQRFNQQLEGVQPKIERADKLTAAIESGDWDGLATALGFQPVAAVGDKPALSAWDALIQDQIDRKADPNYQRLRALERAHAERAERDEQLARQAQAQQEQQQRNQARAAYMANLGAAMKSSKDPLVAAFAEDPMLQNAIFAIQEQEFHATGVPPAPEQAVRMKLRGVDQTPREWLEGIYKRLQPVFGAPAPAPVVTTQTATPKPVVPRTAPVPKPAPARASKWADDQAWRRNAAQRLEDAADAEEREKRRARLG